MDVFLDLDGTLTDPRVGIVRSVNHALGQMGRETVPEEELLSWIGPPLHHSFLAHLGDQALAERAVAHYRERYAKIGLFENAVYEGVPEMMHSLRADGRRLWLATSKARIYAERIVVQFGLADLLDGVFGSELDGTRAEKPALLSHALAETNATRAIMVGDRKYDMLGAAAHDLPAIGALWGYGSREELAGARALAIHPADVPELVTRIWETGGVDDGH